MKISIYFLSILLIFNACTEETHTEVKVSETEKLAISLPISKEQIALMEIKLKTLEEKLIYPSIMANGVVKPKPNHEAVVTPRISGMLDKIFILEGNYVKKGDAMFSISSPELILIQQDFMNACVNVQLFQRDFERQTELKKNNIGSTSDFQLAESKFLAAISMKKSLEQKVKLLGLNVENLTNPTTAKIVSEKIVFAPLEGFINKLTAKIGMSVDPITTLAEIIDLTELHADIYCYEKDLALVGENQQVEIIFVNKNIPSTKGKIFRISRTVDKDTRSIVIHSVFKAPKGFLIMPEMAITAKILGINAGKNSKTVPLTSIFDEAEQSYVFYTSNKDTSKVMKFYKAKVKLGASDGNNVEINFEQVVPHNILIATTNVSNLQSEFAKFESAN
ncbi:MAG: efflux RND transporter periplasmic adaptor subunit [Cytophagales bacterium]|nr:MAG: efflux RND transporter periplasmic adaptor subunit [Cytophagales bacterium]